MAEEQFRIRCAHAIASVQDGHLHTVPVCEYLTHAMGAEDAARWLGNTRDYYEQGRDAGRVEVETLVDAPRELRLASRWTATTDSPPAAHYAVCLFVVVPATGEERHAPDDGAA